jgi:hypothetical protein
MIDRQGNGVAVTRRAANDVPGAIARFERSLGLYREARSLWGEGVNLIGLAHAQLLAGDLDRAEQLLMDSQPLLREAGATWSYGSTFSYLALVALLRGRADDSLTFALKAVACLEPLRDNFDLVFTVVYLACACGHKQADLLAARLLGVVDAVMNATGLGILDPATANSERDTRTCCWRGVMHASSNAPAPQAANRRCAACGPRSNA